MSPKIGIAPDEIHAVLTGIPRGNLPQAGSTALDAAMQAMAAREKRANLVRVVLYRFDDGSTAQADAWQAQLQAGQLPLHRVAQQLNCDLQVIELGRGAFTETDAARAAAFGMMATEQDTGLLVVAAFGAGADARAEKTDAARFLQTASPETAALYGAMIAAARAGIPIIAEGAPGRVAAMAMHAQRPDLAGGIFLCGVAGNVPGIPVFADEADENDASGHSGPGDAAITLAALLQGAFAEREEAA